MDLLQDPLFVTAAVCASFIIGLARSGFGGAIVFIGVLLVAQAVPPQVAAAVVLPMLCFSDPFAVWMYRRQIHWPSIKVLLPGGLLGIAAGAFVIGAVNDDAVRIVVATISLLLVAYAFLYRHAPGRTYKPLTGAGLGAMAGAASCIIHAGHPPVAGYLLPMKLSRMLFIGTFAALFTIFNYVKLVPYALLGLLDASRLGVAAVFFPLVLLGLAVGRWLAGRISDRVFYIVINVATVILGLKMLYEGASGIMAGG